MQGTPNSPNAQNSPYLPNSGPYANLSPEEKKKRLDAMVHIWQSDTERRIERDGYRAFIQATRLDEYRYTVLLRFPEWERSAVVGQVLTLHRSESGAPEDPAIFSIWRHEPLLRAMPDWKQRLPAENVFNISVCLTPGGLGEGVKWATIMPKDMIPRYRPSWPAQEEWVRWTRSFDWLSVAVGFVRAMLDAFEKENQG
jgi:hypothetical protein